MTVSRRGFIKLLGAGTACFGLSRLGLDVKPAQAYATSLKTAGAKEIVSICPYCSCGCTSSCTSRMASSSAPRATRTTL